MIVIIDPEHDINLLDMCENMNGRDWIVIALVSAAIPLVAYIISAVIR